MNKVRRTILICLSLLFVSSCSASANSLTSSIPVSLDELNTTYLKNAKSAYRYFLFNTEINPCLYVQKLNILENKVVLEREVCKVNLDNKTYDFKEGQGAFFDEIKWVDNGLQFNMEYHPSGKTAFSFEMSCFLSITANTIEEPICKLKN